MNWFFSLLPTLRARLFAVAFAMAIPMTILVIVMLQFLKAEIGALKTVYEDRVVPLKQLKVIADAYAVQVVDATHKVRNGNVSWEEGAKSVSDAKGVIDREWQAYLATHLVPEEKRLAEEVKRLKADANGLLADIERLLAAKDEAGMSALATQRLYQVIDPLSEKITALIELQLVVAQQEYAKAAASYEAARKLGIGGLLLSLTAGFFLAWRVSLRVRDSLGAEPGHLRETVTAIGEGRLNNRIKVRQGDEFSVNAQVDLMQSRLSGLVADIRDNAQSLRVASKEISSGNMDLSQRTEQTASSMAEASNRLREVIERVQQRAHHIRGASGMVSNTRVVAEQAGGQMNEAISTMRGINESARRIGDIIGTIDGIAFQTNILALNAAVEAARAGEAGRGFAVVASEVRLLAQRSAEAAKQIKSLIGASLERSEAGARQVDETGQTLVAMVADIQKLSDLVGDIAAQVQQDDVDMGGVLDRLAGVDQAVQQNAALVEEMAASSQGLNEQAERLSTSVEGFRT